MAGLQRALMRSAEAMEQVVEPDPGQDWMLAFQRGDEAAFECIVVHYGARVAAFFRRCGADSSAAEDLAQETFLRIARARHRYIPTAKFTTWLHRIISRIAANEGTRNRWRRSTTIQSGRSDEERRPGILELEDTPRADPAAIVSLNDLRARVRTAVAELPEPQRTALILNRFQGASYDEVAAALDLSIPAVKSLLFRARENVKERLLPFLSEEVIDEL
jgi:RNA polymerase sigma-70 factor (ECF subfamily)